MEDIFISFISIFGSFHISFGASDGYDWTQRWDGWTYEWGMGHLGVFLGSHEKSEMAMGAAAECCVDAGGVLLELFVCIDF